MNLLFQKILGSLLVYKYALLFLVAFFSCFGFPLPAATMVITASAFASQGYLNIAAVVLVAVIGNISGDLTIYSLVRKYGEKVLRWFRMGKLTKSQPLRNVEKIEDNYKFTVIVASRFQAQATAIVNIIAGLGRMNFKKFALYVVIGEILQIFFYAGFGFFFAQSWQALYGTVNKFSWLIILSVTIIVTLASSKITKRIMKK